MNHTLVIPTYNRPEHLRRLIRYYRTRAPSMRLLVLDSSLPAVVEDNARMISGSGTSARHVIYPDTTSLAVKLARGLELVDTAYASICADDDLVFPDALQQAVTFLDDHPDHVGAHGLYLNCRRQDNNIHVTSEYAGPGNEAGHAGARIFRLLQKYESLFYAVFRAGDLREILLAMSKLGTVHYQELFQSAAAVIRGKIRRFATIYAVRQSCEPAQPGREKWQTHSWFADNPGEVFEGYRIYCEALWNYYEKHGATPRLDRDAFSRVMDLSHAVYFSAGCPPRYFHERLQDLWPADDYLAAGRVDLMDGLGRPRYMPRRHMSWQLDSHVYQMPPGQKYPFSFLLWCGWLALRAAPSLFLLNRHVRQTCPVAWQCRLPWELRWLATTPVFRLAYFEFCEYLDGD